MVMDRVTINFVILGTDYCLGWEKNCRGGEIMVGDSYGRGAEYRNNSNREGNGQYGGGQDGIDLLALRKTADEIAAACVQAKAAGQLPILSQVLAGDPINDNMDTEDLTGNVGVLG